MRGSTWTAGLGVGRQSPPCRQIGGRGVSQVGSFVSCLPSLFLVSSLPPFLSSSLPLFLSSSLPLFFLFSSLPPFLSFSPSPSCLLRRRLRFCFSCLAWFRVRLECAVSRQFVVILGRSSGAWSAWCLGSLILTRLGPSSRLLPYAGSAGGLASCWIACGCTGSG